MKHWKERWVGWYKEPKALNELGPGVCNSILAPSLKSSKKADLELEGKLEFSGASCRFSGLALQTERGSSAPSITLLLPQDTGGVLPGAALSAGAALPPCGRTQPEPLAEAWCGHRRGATPAPGPGATPGHGRLRTLCQPTGLTDFPWGGGTAGLCSWGLTLSHRETGLWGPMVERPGICPVPPWNFK